MLTPTPPSSGATASSPPTLISSLQAGQSYGGVVRAQSNGLIAQIGTLQIPLDPASGLEAGQRILVQVQAQDGGLELTIRLQPAATGGGTVPPTVATLLATLLEAVGRPGLAPHSAILAPRQTPANQATLQALISTLIADRGIGKDIQQLQQLIGSATRQGVLSSELGVTLSPWVSLTALADSAAWFDLIRRAQSQRNAVAKLARFLNGDPKTQSLGELKESIQSITRQLTDNPTFQKWLREQGTEETFKALAHRIQERAMGTEVQNLRGLNQHYQFLDLSLPADTGMEHLQIHLFSEGNSAQKGGKPGVSRTVLDLEMTQIGPVWVDLQANADHCQCFFKLSTPPLVAAVNESASELEAALEEMGYARARVLAKSWDGNREEALISLLAPFQGIDFEA